jgi:hypothetical protein
LQSFYWRSVRASDFNNTQRTQREANELTAKRKTGTPNEPETRNCKPETASMALIQAEKGAADLDEAEGEDEEEQEKHQGKGNL